MADAAIHYAKSCREAGILTSLDGGGIRVNTMELLSFIDVAVVSERFCEQLGMSSSAVLDLLKSKGCRIGGVTQGARGILWYDEKGTVQTMAALSVPAREIVDTNGAGDVFHGAYVYSYAARPHLSWDRHFRFARAASAHAIRFLGNEARLPTIADVETAERRFQPAAVA
jgi:sugar/nucleoside kinase (ribokinase family)